MSQSNEIIFSIQYSPVGINEIQQEQVCKKKFKEIIIRENFHEARNYNVHQIKERIKNLLVNRGADFQFDERISPSISDYDL